MKHSEFLSHSLPGAVGPELCAHWAAKPSQTGRPSGANAPTHSGDGYNHQARRRLHRLCRAGGAEALSGYPKLRL